jgi:hypothetical protein
MHTNMLIWEQEEEDTAPVICSEMGKYVVYYCFLSLLSGVAMEHGLGILIYSVLRKMTRSLPW